MRRAVALVLVLAACTGPPWYMGTPLNGRPSIPAKRANVTANQARAEASTARTRGETVLELRALLELDDLERLDPAAKARLVTLLGRRAAEWDAMGRIIPAHRDLERLARLAPARGAGLLGERAAAARAAGDAWLAVGASEEARAAYDRAIELGAVDMDFRVRALWGHPPPATTSLAELRAAIAALPLCVVPPLAAVYVKRGGSDPATLTRGLAAARQERMEQLAARLGDALRAGPSVGGAPREGVNGSETPDAGADAADAAAPVDAPDGGAGDAPAGDAGDGVDAAAVPVPAPVPVPADLDGWLLRGLTISGRFLPLVAAHPELLTDPRAVSWVDLLLAEDDTWADSLEVAAIAFGRVERYGGTERMLMELTYASPDRAVGIARGAVVWEQLGRSRQACAQWISAARWRDDPEDPLWLTAMSCARREPGVADWRDIRAYVLRRARPARRAALAESLDAALATP